MTHAETNQQRELVFPSAEDVAAVRGAPAPPSQRAALMSSLAEHPAEGRVRPRVVMMAGNDITSDARVLKTMTTVAQFDVEVIAVGLSGRGRSARERLGDVDIIRVSPTPRAAVSGLRARFKRFTSGLGQSGTAVAPWFTDARQYRAALGRWEMRTRELRADRGRDLREFERTGRQPTIDTTARVERAARWRFLKLQRKALSGRSLPVRVKKAPRSRRTGKGVGRRRDFFLHTYDKLPFLSRWRSVLPEVIDQDLAIGPVLDRLEPDAIHVHDVFMIGIAVRAAQRAALHGRFVKVIYDAHEYIPGLAMVEPRRVAAFRDLEREFMPDVDRVITVSEPLATLIRDDYDLARMPDVVLNAPVVDDGSVRVVGVREVCGLPDDVPLLVYGGGIHPARGVKTVVDALAQLPDVHLVVVVRRLTHTTENLHAHAERIGVASRLHFAPYVPPEFVPRYLSSATVGMSPLLRAINHDVAITNKFCEYLNGGLPIVTSDTPAQARLVDELGLGAVHVAGDATDCARAVRSVLDGLDQLRDRIAHDEQLRHRFSWQRQAEVLRDVYDEVLGGLPRAAWDEGATKVTQLLVVR
jgi:glycosyltransferase involved in cell wall biosynthesis